MPDVADIFGDASPQQLDPSNPGLMQRIKDRFSSEPQADLSDFDNSPMAIEPTRDIWDDGLLSMEEEQPGLIERIRSHRKVVAAVTALALLGGGTGGVVAAESMFTDGQASVVQEQNDTERASAEEVDVEQKNEEKDPRVLDTPIRPKDVIEREQRGESLPTDEKEGEIPESIKEYNPEFFGAVRTEHGVSFNIYGATQPGQEKSLDGEFKVNPDSIEFMMEEIIKNIPSAPDNLAKHTIIENLQKFKAGEQERVIDMVVDVSEKGGCLDANYQLVTAIDRFCIVAGVARRDVAAQDRIPIVISASEEDKTAVVVVTTENDRPPSPEEIEAARQKAEAEQKELDQNPKPDIMKQQGVILHEIGHAVSDSRDGEIVNEYTEGDHDHEVIDWLLGDRLGKYDLQGSSQQSPMLREKMEQMIKSGELRPVLERISR